MHSSPGNASHKSPAPVADSATTAAALTAHLHAGLASPRLASPGLAAWPSAQQVPPSLRGSHCELLWPVRAVPTVPVASEHPLKGLLFRCTLWQRKDPEATTSDEVEFVMAEGIRTHSCGRGDAMSVSAAHARLAMHLPAADCL